jgi:hypothetical protein
MSAPKSLEALFSTPEVNTSVPLHQGQITISMGADAVAGEGTLVLEWLPKPRLRATLKGTGSWNPIGFGDVSVSLEDISVTTQGYLSQVTSNVQGYVVQHR